MKNILCKIKNKFLRSYDKNIDYNTMMEMQKNDKNIVILDVRTKDEFLYGHLNGAINIPLQELNDNIHNVIKDLNKIIIVYCQMGGRSKKACIKLEKMGYVNVYNLKNGLDGI